MTSQSLTLYRPSSLSTSTTISTNPSRSLSLSRVFSAETGTHVATELLYRILIAIFQRVFNTFEDFASRRIDQFANYLERAKQEREKQRSSKIIDQLAAAAQEKQGENEATWPACPLKGKGQGPPAWAKRRAEKGRGPPGPPAWVVKAAEQFRATRERGEEYYAGSEVAALFE